MFCKECFAKLIRLQMFFLVVFAFLVPVTAGKITGTVRSTQTQKLLQGVSVKIDGTDQTTKTDSSGTFLFDSIQSSSYNLIFSHDKYEPLIINDVFVSAEAEKRIEAELYPPLQVLDKVIVKGKAFRKPPEMSTSTKTMSFDEILRSPGALVDVQRAVQDLPSVSSGGDNTNEIVVRGGNPGENLLLMDNMEIPNPNHFANQGSGGGVVSLINPLLVKDLVFCAGAPPAIYGGKASSVLDVKLRDGNERMVLGGVDLGMAGAGIHAEGPLWKGATFMASGTKSFLDLFSDYADATAIPEFWGLQSKVVQNAGKNKFYWNLLYGKNDITIRDARKEAGTDGDIIEAGGTVYATGVNLETKWSDQFSTFLTVSAAGNSFDRFEYSDTITGTGVDRDTFFVNNSVEQEQMLKLQGAYTLEKGKLQAGLQLKRCDFDIDIWEQPENIAGYQKTINTEKSAYKYAGYLSGIFYPLNGLRVVPGIRVDGFTYNHSKTVSPRLGAVYALSSDIDLTGAFALQYQDPDYTDLAAHEANVKLNPQRVLTSIAGIEYNLRPLTAKLSLEGFYKKYDKLPVDASLLTSDIYDKSDVLYSIGEGYSYGAEAFFQKKLTKNFWGTVSYSLSRAFSKDVRPGHEDEWYRGDYDFRNALTLSGGYKVDLLESEWYRKIHSQWWVMTLSPILPVADRVELSVKWRYLGGRPYTAPQRDEANKRWIINQEHLNDAQYPDYHRLDFRIERRYGFGLLQLIYYFDLQNIYNRKNIWMYLYSNSKSTPTPIYQFSFFPAGGLIIGF